MKRGVQLSMLVVAIVLIVPARAQQFDDYGRGRARDILRNIAEDVRKHYYDSTFHGFDFEGRVREADEKLSHAASVSESYKLIAWALQGLNDSHTYFIPPFQGYKVDYGWQMQMIGSRCYVTRVRPKSDAEAKGLNPGDEVLSVNGVALKPDSLAALEYIIGILSPQPELRIEVRSLGGDPRPLVVAAKVEPIRIMATNIMAEVQTTITKFNKLAKKNQPRCESLGEELAVCKMPPFFLEDRETEDRRIHDLLNLARKHQALILDFRGDGGGTTQVLETLVGGLLDHEVKIGDRLGKEGKKPIVAKPQHDRFAGKLIVLVDSQSGGMSELLARTMQLEKRGTVLGDRSAGAVMESKTYNYHFAQNRMTDYGAMITQADIVMTDGQSLEHKGVTPDTVLLPTPADLANGNDPVLARAAELLGVKLAPDKAGKLFPFEWPAD